jgi:hypothetical protein
MAAVLVLGSVAIGATQFAGGTEAQGTWQYKSFEITGNPTNDGEYPVDPGLFLDDWVRSLPENCDIVVENSILTYFYRCPE